MFTFTFPWFHGQRLKLWVGSTILTWELAFVISRTRFQVELHTSLTKQEAR